MDKNPVASPHIRHLLAAAALAALSATATAAPAPGPGSALLTELRARSEVRPMVAGDVGGRLIRSFAGAVAVGTPEAPAEQTAGAFLARYGALFGAAGAELGSPVVRETPRGDFVRYQQHWRGMEVEGAEIVLLVRDGAVRTVRSYLQPEVAPAGTSGGIGLDQAVRIAQERAPGAPGASPEEAAAIVRVEGGKARILYRIQLPFVAGPEPSRYRVYVDATTGKVVELVNRVMSAGQVTGTGTGLDGVTKQFPTWFDDTVYWLGDIPDPAHDFVRIKTYTANNGTALPGDLGQDADNVWDDPSLVDAHFYGNYVHDFYDYTFGDKGWYFGSGFDQSGGLISTVHYDQNYDNAFWNGRQMVYGDGGTIFYPLAGAIDVVAHEITHGVTEAINNLNYCKEPGALNESWSDVMGTLVAIRYGDDLPYQIGEDIMKIDETPGNEGYYALRRMDDPPFRTDAYDYNDYDPADPLNSWGQPEHTSEQYIVGSCWPWNDNGGVHINSGIPNKAAYLIIDAIGATKTEQIYYYGMFNLSATSQFTDARAALELATLDLYGNGPELAAVQAAFDAVGIPGGF